MTAYDAARVTERIEVEAQGEHAYSVTLHDSHRTTHHQVVVPPELLDQLGLDGGDEELLVRKSFEFLLERETSTSILKEFRLDVIGRYFHDYVETLRRRLSQQSC